MNRLWMKLSYQNTNDVDKKYCWADQKDQNGYCQNPNVMTFFNPAAETEKSELEKNHKLSFLTVCCLLHFSISKNYKRQRKSKAKSNRWKWRFSLLHCLWWRQQRARDEDERPHKTSKNNCKASSTAWEYEAPRTSRDFLWWRRMTQQQTCTNI